METLNFEDFSSEDLTIFQIESHPELIRECLRLLPCKEDREELSATRGKWQLSVDAATKKRGAHGCIYKGRVRALFGFSDDEIPNVLLPWLISDGIIQKERPIAFSRICRKILGRVAEENRTLLNWAMEDCRRYDWLESLGFSIDVRRLWFRGKPSRRFILKPTKEKRGDV